VSTPFQNRLVGTIIVAAAVIIFLPDILDGEKQSYQADFEAIPQAPKFSSSANKPFPQEKLSVLSKEKFTDEAAIDEIKNAQEENLSNDNVKVAVLTKLTKTKPEKTKQVPAKKVKPAPPKSLPQKAIIERAWVIHLGSFRHQQNVKELLAKLKKNGYVAFTRPIKTKNGTLTKVFVGPELIKSSLEKKLPKLKALTDVQGKVARYNPTNNKK
jgi:DedD protein